MNRVSTEPGAIHEGELGMVAYGDEDGISGGHDGCTSWYLVSRKADD
jgi:hypothetical protein